MDALNKEAPVARRFAGASFLGQHHRAALDRRLNTTVFALHSICHVGELRRYNAELVPVAWRRNQLQA